MFGCCRCDVFHLPFTQKRAEYYTPPPGCRVKANNRIPAAFGKWHSLLQRRWRARLRAGRGLRVLAPPDDTEVVPAAAHGKLRHDWRRREAEESGLIRPSGLMTIPPRSNDGTR